MEGDRGGAGYNLSLAVVLLRQYLVVGEVMRVRLEPSLLPLAGLGLLLKVACQRGAVGIATPIPIPIQDRDGKGNRRQDGGEGVAMKVRPKSERKDEKTWSARYTRRTLMLCASQGAWPQVTPLVAGWRGDG